MTVQTIQRQVEKDIKKEDGKRASLLLFFVVYAAVLVFRDYKPASTPNGLPTHWYSHETKETITISAPGMVVGEYAEGCTFYPGAGTGGIGEMACENGKPAEYPRVMDVYFTYDGDPETRTQWRCRRNQQSFSCETEK
jgi:hypothetical protein